MWRFLKRLAGMFRALRSDLQAATAKYFIEKQVIEVLKLTHAQELLTYPRNEWPLVHQKQVEEIRAVSAGKPFDIVDRKSWCYSDDTEVMTRRGWVGWPQVVNEDELQVPSDDGSVAFVSPDNLVCFDYKGQMIHFNGSDVDQLVTPDHGMYGRVVQSSGQNELGEPARHLAKDLVGALRIQVPVDARGPKHPDGWREVHSVGSVDYDGKVYCATVPGGLLYVRRNGKAAWCGNSFPYL
jgi:hypothetical protein